MGSIQEAGRPAPLELVRDVLDVSGADAAQAAQSSRDTRDGALAAAADAALQAMAEDTVDGKIATVLQLTTGTIGDEQTTLVAAVDAVGASGWVSFARAGLAFASAELDDGQATITVATRSLVGALLSAEYSGDDWYAGSVGSLGL